jgi:hypothetical protein
MLCPHIMLIKKLIFYNGGAKIVIYERREDIFGCFICANVPNTSSCIEVCTLLCRKIIFRCVKSVWIGFDFLFVKQLFHFPNNK